MLSWNFACGAYDSILFRFLGVTIEKGGHRFQALTPVPGVPNHEKYFKSTERNMKHESQFS